MNTNRGIINEITDYKDKHYKVRYDNNEIDWLPIRNLREGRPTRLSKLELKYWNKHKNNIPQEIKALMKA